jgi:hypothetical protein
VKLLPNGNIEMTVQLLPSAYAALRSTAERDKGSFADIVNVAVLSYAALSAAATQAGQSLSMEEPSGGEAP